MTARPVPSSDVLLQAVVDELRAATGNLPPALIVKVLDLAARCSLSSWTLRSNGVTDDEIKALRAATFEVKS